MLQDWTKTTSKQQVFLRKWSLRKKGKDCARVSWYVLITQVYQCSQIMIFDCWTLVGCIRSESLARQRYRPWGLDLGV